MLWVADSIYSGHHLLMVDPSLICENTPIETSLLQ